MIEPVDITIWPRPRLRRAKSDARLEGSDGEGLHEDGGGRHALGHERQQRLDRHGHLARGTRDHRQLVFRRGKGASVKHHRTFGGTGYVWLRSPSDAEAATKILRGLEGVNAVLTRAEAARRFHLMPERIGELVVLGDRETVFGETEPQLEVEHLPPTFRTHGSLHEATVPLVIYNASGTLPAADTIRANFEMTRTLYRD